MENRPPEQLDKVLALADSSHDAEAVVAVRMARQLLSRDGLRFSDLAKAAQTRNFSGKGFSFFSGASVHLEAEVAQLRQKLDDLEEKLASQKVQAEFWRRRASELEQHFTVSQSETVRWRQLARDTVDKLWGLGQEVRSDDIHSGSSASSEPVFIKTL